MFDVDSKYRDIPRWYSIFQLLSMERTDPFLSEMGLSLSGSDIDAIRPIVRHFVEGYEASDRASAAAEGNPAADAFRHIAQAAGDDTAQILYRWGTEQFVYSTSESASEFIWSVLLRQLSDLGDHSDDLTVSMSISSEKVTAIINMAKEYSSAYDDLALRIEQAEHEPMMAWEERVYRTYEPPCSPLDHVLSVIDYHRVRQVLRTIELLLDSESMQAFLRWAESHGERLGISKDLIVLLS